ncbi:MAG: glycoside hydrolase family 31 protein [Planctomycetota bacterium]
MSRITVQKTVTFSIMFLIIYLVLPLSSAWAYTIMGNIKSKTEDGHNITFECENGKVRLSFLKENLIRVHMAPAGKDFPKDDLHLDENGPYAVVNYTWPGVKLNIKEEFDYDLEGAIYKITAGKLIAKVRKQPFRLAFHDASNSLLTMEKVGIIDAGLGYEGDKVYETMSLDDDEHFFGFGAHNHPLDMRGRKIKCYAKELEKKREDGGFPVPFFMSNRGYGIFFNNLDDDVTFNMGTEPEQYSFEGTSGAMEGWDMDYYLIYGPTFEDILKTYTEIVGKPILPEKWYFGHIQHHCCDWVADSVMEAAKKYRENDWPCDVLIMDHQALGKDLEWDTGYENQKQMYDYITPMGFKTAFSTAMFDADMYNWQGFDPTNEELTAKHWKLHIPRVKDGMDFWRQDNSERSMQYTGLKNFANGYKAHQLFGSLWAKGVVEGMESLGLYGRPVISRGGPIGGHRYIVPWAGDTPHGLQFQDIDLTYIRNGSLSLYSSISVDLGGFTDRGKGKPLEEQNVMRRVVNMSLFVPISKFQGAGDASAKLPWLYTPKQQDLFRYYMKLRYRLLPYRYSAAIEAHLTGRPLLSSLVVDYLDDENTYDKDFHFMIGRSILVAPVMEKTEEWKVYLPKGKWIHYWTGKEYQGNQTVTVAAPLYGKDGLPMFIKSGAIIPMMPDMKYIYEKEPDPITLDIYPGDAPSEYVMYDCETVRGPFKQTKFTCTQDSKAITITIGPSDSNYELWIHYDKQPSKVQADSKDLKQIKDKAAYDSAKQGWYFGQGCFYGSDSTKTINIKIQKSKEPRVIRIQK